MNTHKQIQQIAVNDDRLTSKVDFTPICKAKDLNHLQRRQQQRAITNEMMQIAIAYGQKHYDHRGATIYTLRDRQLKYSPYAKLASYLRGLQVICTSEEPILRVVTTYWNFDAKQSVRK
ncbi:MAG: hypothetical protein ACK5RE_06310 [Pseudanabaena sp.]